MMIGLDAAVNALNNCRIQAASNAQKKAGLQGARLKVLAT
jgi:hypothetical protein